VKVPAVAEPPDVATVTDTAPATATGDTAVSEAPPGATTIELAGMPPKSTAVPAEKPFPLTVICVPPVVGPEDGERPVTVGGAPVQVSVSVNPVTGGGTVCGALVYVVQFEAEADTS
jgi:hypothetical protein